MNQPDATDPYAPPVATAVAPGSVQRSWLGTASCAIAFLAAPALIVELVLARHFLRNPDAVPVLGVDLLDVAAVLFPTFAALGSGLILGGAALLRGHRHPGSVWLGLTGNGVPLIAVGALYACTNWLGPI